MITNDLQKAKEVLINNGVVAIPTETVYGLAGNAFSDIALKKIYQLKNRPFYNPLIVHIKSVEVLNQVVKDIPELALKLAYQFWPGPLTLILKKQDNISDIVTSGKDTVAVRVPNHPLTLSLLNILDFPLAAPSANPFGSISPTSAQHVLNYFNDELEVILDGGICQKGIESTIIGFQNNKPVLYRHGSISVEEIEECIGKITFHTTDNKAPNAPGMLSSHYAPKTNTYLVDDVASAINSYKGKKIGLLLFSNKILGDFSLVQEVLSINGDLDEAATNLYAALHRLDNSNLDVIIAERFPNMGLGRAINDRLERAKINSQ